MRGAAYTAAAAALLLGTGLVLGACVFSAPAYRGPTSDHFDGTTFHNQVRAAKDRNGSFFQWVLTREKGPWPEWIDAPAGPPPPQRVEGDRLRVTFINHATTLLQMDGLNVLTDPIWSYRASPLSFAGPARHRPPGIRFEDLPPIDLVVISHNHYDHLDLPTLRRLAEEHSPEILVPLGNAALLNSEDIAGGRELDWWQSHRVSDAVEVSCAPSRHFSGRGITDHGKTLWCAWVIEGSGGAVYFAGDTGYGPHFAQAAERHGPFRFALLPIGAYRPRWFMGPVHISPAEAVQAHMELRASTSMGIHFGTFSLADDGYQEPLDDLSRALGEHDPVPRFWTLKEGEGRYVPPARVDAPVPRVTDDSDASAVAK